MTMTDPKFSERRPSHRGRESPFPSDRERGGFGGGRPGIDLRTTDPPNANALEVRPVLDTGYNGPAPTCNRQRVVAHPGRVQNDDGNGIRHMFPRSSLIQMNDYKEDQLTKSEVLDKPGKMQAWSLCDESMPTNRN